MKTIQNYTFFKTHELHEVLTKVNIFEESINPLRWQKNTIFNQINEPHGKLVNDGVFKCKFLAKLSTKDEDVKIC